MSEYTSGVLKVALPVGCLLLGGTSSFLMYQDLKNHQKSKLKEPGASEDVEKELEANLNLDIQMIGRIKLESVEDLDQDILTLQDWDRIFRVQNKHIMIQSEFYLKDLK